MAVTLGLYKAHFWTWTNSWEEFKQVRGLGPMEPSWGGLLAPGLGSWEPPEVSWEPPEGVLGQVLGAGLREEKGCAMPVPTKSVTSPCRVSDAQGLRQEGGFVCGCDLLHLWAKPTRSAQGHSSAPSLPPSLLPPCPPEASAVLGRPPHTHPCLAGLQWWRSAAMPPGQGLPPVSSHKRKIQC